VAYALSIGTKVIDLGQLEITLLFSAGTVNLSLMDPHSPSLIPELECGGS